MLIEDCMSGTTLCNLADDTDAVYMHEPLPSPQHRLSMSEKWAGSSMCSSSTSSFAPMIRSPNRQGVGRCALPFDRPTMSGTHQSHRSSLHCDSPLSPNDVINLDLWSNADRKPTSTQRTASHTRHTHQQAKKPTSPVPRIHVTDAVDQSMMR